MQWSSSVSVSGRANNLRQAYVLLMIGIIFLVVAWMGTFKPYPIGESFFGLGMLVAAPFNTHRFLAAGWLVMLIGLAGFLIFGHVLPDTQILATHVLAIGLGLLGITCMVRRRYIHADALTPSLLVVGVSIVEYLQAAYLTPTHFLSFVLSLWFPGYGLLVLGLVSLVMSGRAYKHVKRHIGNKRSLWDYCRTSCKRERQVKRKGRILHV